MANGGTVDLTLRVHSDVAEARKDIQSLQSSLQNLVTQKNSSNPLQGLTEGATKAAHEIAELNLELNRSKNASGGLDAAKLAKIWDSNGKSLEYYKTHLQALGPSGEKAFTALATSIARAQAPMRELDGLIGKFAKGLLNTAMWTIQSNAIHGFQRAIQGATRYAQELNKGLTDIAIVSDLSSEKLAQFAKDANRYAQQYSTTTSEYVKGALIYYQQGLSGEEVLEKTNTTVKMANTSGETAEQISSYMTAIWNNFDDGSKSVEYFADVISYLGAETAASNADIAEGMQAFAATANTVGLSYEYAASALTTLRHVTQQSASTIGNSLKTIFARLSSVSLGETLEDDVDLTKYTKALADIGVNVVKANGDLKDMDSILDDLAGRWDELTNAQKVAVAQTVGGVRQYNNLISLMDNYDYFKTLVEGSKQADGYLDKQNEKFEESWLGATNHIKTAVQKLYDVLINDKFLISITNLGAKIIDIVSTIVDKAGGLRTLLPLIVSVLSTGINNSLHDILQTVQQITTTTFGWKKYAQGGQNLQATAANFALSAEIPIPQGISNPKQYESIRREVEGNINEIRELLKAGAPPDVIEKFNALIDRDTIALKDFFTKTAQYEQELQALGDSRKTLEPLINKAANTGLAYDFVAGADFGKLKYKDIAEQLGTFGISDFTLDVKNKNKKTFNGETFKNRSELQQKLQEWLSSKYEQAEKELQDEMQKAAEKEAAKHAKNTKTSKTSKKDSSAEKTKITNDEAKANSQLADSEKTVEVNAKKVIDAKKAELKASEDLQAKTETLRQAKEELTNAETGLGQSIAANREAMKGQHDQMIAEQQDRAHQINAIVGVASAYSSLISAGDKFWSGIGEIFKDGKVEEGLKTLGSSLTMMGTATVQLNRAMSILANTNKDLYLNLSDLGKAMASGVPSLLGFGTAAKGTAISVATGIKTVAVSLGEMLSAMLPIIATGLVVAGIFKLIGKGIEWIKNQSPEEQFKKLQETTKDLAEAADKAEEAFDKVASTLNGLDDNYNKLDGLTKGTQEWRNAVHELNKELLLLVNKYGLVYGEDYEYKDGVIHFTESGEKKLRDQSTADATKAQHAAQDSALAESAAAYTKARSEAYDPEAVKDVIERTAWADQEFTNKLLTLIDNPELLLNAIREYGEKYFTRNGTDEFGDAAYEHRTDIDTASLLLNRDFSTLLNFATNYANDIATNSELVSKQNEATNDAVAIAQELFGERYSSESIQLIANAILAGINQNIKDLAREDVDAYAESIGFKREGSQYVNLTDKDANPITDASMRNMYAANQAYQNLDISALNLIEDKYKLGARLETVDHDRGQEGFSKDDISHAERYAEVVANINELTEEWTENDKDRARISKDLANDYINFNKGLSDIIKNYDNYVDNLKHADESSMDFVNTIGELRNDFELMLDIDSKTLDDGFFSENRLKIATALEQAAKGNFDALYDLQELAAQHVLPDANEITADLQDEYATVIANINNSEQWEDVKIGASFDSAGIGTEFADAMDELLKNGEITVQQLNDTFDAIGWEPEITYDTMTVAEAKAANVKGYVKVGDNYQEVEDYTKLDTSETIYIPKLNRKKTTYKGSPPSRVNKSNRDAANKNKGSSGSKSKSKEIDRYHEINSQIEQNAHLLDMVNTAESRAYGPDKLHLMDEKIKLLERESELYKQLYDEAKAYYDADRARLANEFGAQFNEDGSIANYDKWFGAYIAKYNAGQMSDEQMQKLEDYIKKYEDSLKHLNDAEKKYQDDLNKIYDLKLEKIEYRLKTINKLIDQANNYLDYMIKQLDKSMYDTADVIALLGEKIGNVLQQAENERAAIGEIFANHGLSDEDIEAFISGQADIADILEKVGTLTEDEVSKLQEHQSALLQYNETLIQIREESYEKIGESIDEFNEKIDRQIDIIKDLDGVMSHYKNIIDIVGKDVLGISDEMLKQMDELAVTAAKSSLEISANQYNENLAKLEEMRKHEKELREQGLIEDADLMQKEIEAQEDRVNEFREKYMSSWEDALKAAETAFLNTIKRTTDAFGEAMAGQAKTLDNLREYYDMQKTLQDRYLPTYQKIYELNKLTRDVNNAIDNTTNIAGKQRLLELQEDILKRQKEGVEVTEYEIGFLQRRLELEQARIAMEEAQNAKSMVRMTRDSEGNWSYTYTADSDKADAARQNYEDKLYELKKYNQESLQSFQEALMQAVDDYKNSIADVNMTDEERAQKIKEFAEEWVEHNKGMFQMAIDDAHWIIGEYNGGLDDLIDKFDETILAHETGFTDLEEYMTTFTEASDTMMQSVTGAYQQWQTNTELIFKAAGTTIDDFRDKVLEDMKDAEEAMIGDEDGNGGAVNAAKTLGEEMKSVFDDILKNLKKWFSGEGGYSSQIDSIAEKNKILYNSIQSLITQYNNLTKAATDYANTPQGSGVQGGGGTPGATGGGSGNNNNGSSIDKPIDNGHWEWNDTKHWWVQQWSKSGTKHTKEAAHTFSHVPGAPSNIEKCTVCGYTHEKKNSGGGGSSGGGCFVAGTRITMANGSIQYIENIKIGDMVMAYNDETQEFEPREVTKSYIHHDTPAVINVYFEDGTVLGMTPGHPLLSTKGWKSRDIENSLYEHGTIATWLEVNDEIINLYHQTVKVTAIIKQNIPEHYDTYNIEVETCHTFIADGMVVHNMKMFDSGGYTGSFGPEGRIAMLHEKELVLNKADTENLLTTISFVRDLTRMISLNAAEAGNGLGNLFSTGVGQGGGFLDQNVTIHAEFPNATNHSEIEEAFSNLIGLASQYAGRRR